MHTLNLWRMFKRSLAHALSGIHYALREERNFQIELVIGIAAIVATFFFPLSPAERSIIFLLVGMVLSLELMNTAFERVLDMLKPRIHPYVKVVKDVVAGAVLVSSLIALLVGLCVFLPYVLVLTRYA